MEDKVRPRNGLAQKGILAAMPPALDVGMRRVTSKWLILEVLAKVISIP